MWLRVERRLAKARAAWRCGQLGRARELTERLLAERPGLVEALVLAARVSHESGESQKALDLLEEAGGPAPEAGFSIHRALIAYDLGEESAFSEALDALGSSNRLAPALRALKDARDGHRERLVFPRSALWNPEVAGRLLALLEGLHAERTSPGEDTFHHRLFSPGGAGETRMAEAPAEGRPKGPWNPDSWRNALEDAFGGRRFARFLEIWSSPGVDDGWRSPDLFDLWLFSHHAASPPRTTVVRADELLESFPRNLHFHFIRGLALIRVPRRVEAAHAFARAARLEDDPIYRVVTELASRCEVKLAESGRDDLE